MGGPGVVDARLNPVLAQLRLKRVALFDLDDVEVVHVVASQRFLRKADAGVGEPFRIPARDGATAGIPGLEMSQFPEKDRRLQLIEPAVIAARDGGILGGLTVDPQRSEALCDSGLVGDHHPGVAERAEVLRGIKTVAAGIAHRARDPAVVPRPVRLGAVFDEPQPVRVGERQDRAHVRALAIEMDGEDRFRARGHT